MQVTTHRIYAQEEIWVVSPVSRDCLPARVFQMVSMAPKGSCGLTPMYSVCTIGPWWYSTADRESLIQHQDSVWRTLIPVCMFPFSLSVPNSVKCSKTNIFGGYSRKQKVAWDGRQFGLCSNICGVNGFHIFWKVVLSLVRCSLWRVDVHVIVFFVAQFMACRVKCP